MTSVLVYTLFRSMEDSTIFYRPVSGSKALTQQRAIIAELFSSALGAAVSDFRDPRVCRHFLAGLCISTLFRAGRGAISAPCEKIHDEVLQRAYAAARRAGEPGYEAELIRFLEDNVSRNEREVSMTASRVGIDGQLAPRVDAENHSEAEAHTKIIAEKAAALEAAGATAVSLALEEELNAATRDKFVAQAGIARAAVVESAVMFRVCASCGNALNLADSDERLADHFMGSHHLGWSAIRATLKKLIDSSRAPAPPPKGNI